MPSRRKFDLGRFAAHLEVDVARPGAFGLMDQLLQNFRCIAVWFSSAIIAFQKCVPVVWTRLLQFCYKTNELFDRRLKKPQPTQGGSDFSEPSTRSEPRYRLAPTLRTGKPRLLQRI